MSASTGSSRIENARRKSADAKRRLGVVAGVSFVTALLLAWVSHTGSQPASGASTTDGSSDQTQAQPTDSFDFGAGLIAPSGGGAPTTGTHVS